LLLVLLTASLHPPITGSVGNFVGHIYGLQLHIYGKHVMFVIMKRESVRTTVDIPIALHRRLKQQATAQGRSTRELILLGIRKALLEHQRVPEKRMQFPLIVSKGPKIDLTNERIYDSVGFP
jgi:hypothetical protein